MTKERTVWLANSHGAILGDTNLYVEEMLDQNKEDSNSPKTNVLTFVNAFLLRLGCEDSINEEEAQGMIDSVVVENGKYIVSLPKRFSCPKHGFANSSV